MQGWFIIQKSVSITYHINMLKAKIHAKNPHLAPFIVKTVNKLRIEGNFSIQKRPLIENSVSILINGQRQRCQDHSLGRG
jgi:hypothetical protein